MKTSDRIAENARQVAKFTGVDSREPESKAKGVESRPENLAAWRVFSAILFFVLERGGLGHSYDINRYPPI